MINNSRTVKVSIVGLFSLSILYTLYFASDFFIPLTLAILLYLVLRPVLRFMGRFGLSPPAAAAVILVAVTALLVTGIVYLAGPIQEWFRDLPNIAHELQYKVRALREPIEAVSKASEQVQKMAEVKSSTNKEEEVVIKGPDLLQQVAAALPVIGVQVMSTMILLFFFLSYSTEMMRRLLQVLRRDHRADLVELTHNVERELSRYLATITAINVALGVAIGVGMYAIGMPTPYLWGVMATLLNFVPYLGLLAGAIVVTIVGLLSFDDPVYALLAPGIYLFCNALEGQVITPGLVGRRLLVSPMVIFLAAAFWAWLWGPLGALLAVPMMIVMKIVADSVPSLRPIGHVIGHDAPDSTEEAEA